ncbi:dnaJ homolog subfamily C member 16-like [Babylonia areolata]|uniref:dnaJ homolog subfamily C member 16-like n=1 Tax=Babylonia areolata TaxID=304850 RepID=UPI003FD4B541
MLCKLLYSLILIICCFTSYTTSAEDLYDVLGVRKGATTQEIKSAYKKLAREWHPDKNKAPDATDRFTKINEAYETLSDDEKRRDYDNFGYTTAQERPQRRQPDFGFPFEDFFSGQGFTFGGFGGGFGRQAESVIDKHMTTLRNFETKLQPESHQQPCFLYAFGNFCFNCMRMEHILEKLFEELESVGLCIATIHIHRNPDLASHLRIYNVPSLMGLVNGRVSHMKAEIISLQALREFVRQLFPRNTLQRLKDSDVDTFLDGWRNNLMTAIFFSPRLEPSARFLAPAFFHRDRIAFAFVSTSMEEGQGVMQRFNINKRRETFLMFNEETSSPVATLSMQQLSRSTLEEVITSNRFLMLPRLSSQSVFDELCPREPKIKRRKLCVALITNKIADHDAARDKFRQFAQVVSSSLNPERLRFVYLYEEVQQKVMQVLTKGNSTRKTTVLEVVIIWHQDQRRVSYEFLEQGWSLEEGGVDASRAALKKRLTELLESDHLLPYKAVMPDFYNEHALNLLTRMLYKILDWADRIWFFLAGYHPQTYFMTVMAIVMAAIMCFIIKKMNDAEEAQVRSQMKTTRKQPRPPSSTHNNQTIHLYELRYESYSNLVKDADTGLTIVVLVNEDSKTQLLHTFAEIMQPYSRYSALTFGFLQLEYYIPWYQHLLEQTLSYKVKLDSINIRNCIGTVLALNGYRKYYYIYHPRNAQRWMRKHSRVGQAMGFMDSDSDSDGATEVTEKPETDEKIFLNEVLSGLSLWMDRVFDGSVRKVRLEYWPEMSM